MAEAVAWVSRIASRTLANTGFPRCVSPAFLGFVPPTTFVPGICQSVSSNICSSLIAGYHIR